MMTPVEVMEKAIKEHAVFLAPSDFSEDAVRALFDALPQLMHALLTRDPAALDAVTDRLAEGWCWHVPPCGKGERCDNSEPNREQRILAGVEERPAEETEDA